VADQKMYNAPWIDLAHFGETLEHWFKVEGFETQLLPSGEAAVTVQARMKKDWRQYVMGTSALSVMATRQGDNLFVQAGAAKWTDKVVGGVAALIIFWPLAALPAYGAIKQKQLIDETFQFIDRYVASQGEVTLPPTMSAFGATSMPTPGASPAKAAAPSATEVACPACGNAVRSDAKFCDNCGQRVTQNCAQCNAPLRPGAKFCDECGAKVETPSA
jgi:predicted nucleic acid-binding Zn ribbon protein